MFDPELHNRIHQSLGEYTSIFVQRLPRYAIKNLHGGNWRTRQKALADVAVLAHLEGLYFVGSLGRWYPECAILDVDSREKNEASDIRAALGLHDSNSFMQASESQNSFHILFRPQLNGRPPTLRGLHTALDGFGKEKRVEVYPQRGRVIRLPFGPYQPILDSDLAHLQSWDEKLFWFMKLDEFELSTIEGTQQELVLTHSPEVIKQCRRQVLANRIDEDAVNLLTHGLQAPSSRDAAQFTILLHYFRQNVSLDTAISEVWRWITTKNNGLSKDFQRYPDEVKKHIQHQAASIYSRYDFSSVYPDSTHNQHEGYICRPDIEEIIRIAGGNMPRSKFLFNLVKYSYPRRFRDFIGFHRDRLVSWASNRTYQKYLDELDNKGIARRGRAYSTDAFSKDLKLKWQYRSSDEAILYTGRSLDTIEDTLQLIYKPPELRELLIAAGASKQAAYEVLKRTFESKEKRTHIVHLNS